VTAAGPAKKLHRVCIACSVVKTGEKWKIQYGVRYVGLAALSSPSREGKCITLHLNICKIVVNYTILICVNVRKYSYSLGSFWAPRRELRWWKRVRLRISTSPSITLNKLLCRTGMVQLRHGPCVTRGSHSFYPPPIHELFLHCLYS